MADFRRDTRDFLMHLEKSELVTRLMALQKHVSETKEKEFGIIAKKEHKQRDVDWSKASYRRIALKFAYLGAKFNGLQIQTACASTVESHLWRAIVRAKLRKADDMPGEGYSRCARTDKGVSAFQQVVTINLRTKGSATVYSGSKNGADEFDYVTCINGSLPPEIRILAWCPVSDTFDARHNCTHRVYQYNFPITSKMDLTKMQNACDKLIGFHDYRNFCKINMSTAMHHERRILSATVSKSENNEKLAQLVIASSGFLYHQIRYTVTILLKIGVGLEKVELIDELLDIVTNPQRPQMHMASDAPLILTNCEFGIREDGFGDANGKIEAKYNMPVKNKTEELNWVCKEPEKIKKAISNLWFEKTMEQQHIETLIKVTGMDIFSSDDLLKHVSKDFHTKQHVPFMKRTKCASLENEIAADKIRLERRAKRKAEYENGDSVEAGDETPKNSKINCVG